MDKRIRLDDDEWIDVSDVREIHTLAVGLEDLSGVTTATSMLVDSGVLNANHIPWTVSLHDLRIVCELLERPAELLVYLRRRTHPQATLKFLAVDELDLYLHFLSHGLYVEPDPVQSAAQQPWMGEPTTAALRRYNNQSRQLIVSQTEPLDAWYAAQEDPSLPAAVKPSLNSDVNLLRLVDDLAATGNAGWLPTSAILLEESLKAQRQFSQFPRRLARKVKEDGNSHSITHILTDTGGSPFVLIWACCGSKESPDAAGRRLEDYLSAKKHQVGALRAAALLFDSRGASLLKFLFDNRDVGPDPDLDLAASTLIPLDFTAPPVPPPTRRNRNSKKRKR